MPDIYLDNDFEAEAVVTRKNSGTGVTEPAAGLTGLTFRLSTTDGGATIAAALSVTATERPAKPGTYYAVLQGSDLRANSVALASSCYLVFGDGVNVHTSQAKVVRATRPPG